MLFLYSKALMSNVGREAENITFCHKISQCQQKAFRGFLNNSPQAVKKVL